MAQETVNESCEIPSVDWSALDGSFEEVKQRLSAHATWVRFFGVRPCCPAPGAKVARSHIAELKERIAQKPELNEEERQELSAMADDRLVWYMKSFKIKD